MYEHKCKEKLDVYTISMFEELKGFGILEDIHNEDRIISGIKFCPWCGVKLEEST